MRKLFLILITIIVPLSVFGQHTFGFKASAGLSKIISTSDVKLTVHKNYFALSGAEGLFYNRRLRKKHLFGAELLFMQIRGKVHTENYASGQVGNLSGTYYIKDNWSFVSYVGVPIYYGFRYKKLNVNLGFQALLTMKSRGRIEGINGQNSVSVPYETKINKLDVSNYNYGPRAGIMFSFTRLISVEAVYYHGINNILVTDSTLNEAWTVRQITIGIRCKLYELEIDPKKINAVLE